MQLTFPIPDPILGENLRVEIETAVNGPVSLRVVGDELIALVPDSADAQLVATIVAAHTGELTPEQQAAADADAEAAQNVRDLGPILDKCRAVLAGQGSFTSVQRDRLLAALVIAVYRRLH